jgi:hypothetical protein
MIGTSQCEHCGAAVDYELDGWHESAVGDCPHCKQETKLRRTEIYAPPKNVAKNRAEMLERLDREPPKWRPVGNGAEVIFYLIGFGLLALAAVAGTMERTDDAIGAGLASIVPLGFATVLGHLRNIAEKPRS